MYHELRRATAVKYVSRVEKSIDLLKQPNRNIHINERLKVVLYLLMKAFHILVSFTL